MPRVTLNDSDRGWYSDTQMAAQRHRDNAVREADNMIGQVTARIVAAHGETAPIGPPGIKFAMDASGKILDMLWGAEAEAFLSGALIIPGAVVPPPRKPNQQAQAQAKEGGIIQRLHAAKDKKRAK